MTEWKTIGSRQGEDRSLVKNEDVNELELSWREMQMISALRKRWAAILALVAIIVLMCLMLI